MTNIPSDEVVGARSVSALQENIVVWIARHLDRVFWMHQARAIPDELE